MYLLTVGNRPTCQLLMLLALLALLLNATLAHGATPPRCPNSVSSPASSTCRIQQHCQPNNRLRNRHITALVLATTKRSRSIRDPEADAGWPRCEDARIRRLSPAMS